METIKNYLYKRNEIIFAYLYGSFVKGTNNKESDLDIAIYIDENQKPASSKYGYRSYLISEIQAFKTKDIDLIILNESPNLITFNVLKEGRLLFSKSNKIHNAFKKRIMDNYTDRNKYNLFKTKLNKLNRNIELLNQYKGIPFSNLNNNINKIWTIERGIQLCLKLMLDIGKYILLRKDIAGKDNEEILQKLIEQNIIPKRLGENIIEMEIMNLIENHNSLEEKQLNYLLTNGIDDFEKIAFYINRYLELENEDIKN